MPLYNCAEYVESALRSIAQQSFGAFEIIAVNDGSADATGAILDAFAKREPRCRVFHTANHGIVAALNFSINQSRGEYLARMDGDDIARADRFEKQVEYLDANSDCVCVGSLYRTIDQSGAVTAIQRKFDGSLQTNLSCFPPFIVTPPHPSIMVRNSIMREVGGYRAQFPHAEDYDLFLRLSGRGCFHVIQEHLLDYRVHELALSHRNIEHQIDSSLLAVLSALAVSRGLEDICERSPEAGRSAYYASFKDDRFPLLFEAFRELRLLEGQIYRRDFKTAHPRIVVLAESLMRMYPICAADRRYWGLIRRSLAVGARLVLRRI